MKKEYWFVAPIGPLVNEIVSALQNGDLDKTSEKIKCYDEHGNEIPARDFWEVSYQDLLNLREDKRFQHEVFRRVGIDGRLNRYDFDACARKAQVKSYVRRGSTEIGKRRPFRLV